MENHCRDLSFASSWSKLYKNDTLVVVWKTGRRLAGSVVVKGIFKDSVCDFSVDLHYDFGSGDGEMLNRFKKKKF